MVSRLLLMMVLVVSGFSMGFISPLNQAQSISQVQSTQGLKVGDVAPTFKLKNIDGKMWSPEDDSKSKGYIVVFSCNHCPWVVKYEERYKDLHAKFASKGFPLIAINANDPVKVPEDTFEKMQERAKDKKFKFAYLMDETQQVAKDFGAEKTPHVYVVARENGQLVVKYIGAIDDNANEPKSVKERYVEQAVEAILAGKEVSIKETKAIGCGIKWKQA
jgi:peroxiredoxin